jgi:S1-C subfamily serine protease
MRHTLDAARMMDMSTTSLLSFSDQLADAVAAAAPSVVQVQGRRRPASGVVFAEGLIVTTTRALGREDGLQLRTGDGRTLEAELGGWDPATGLVVLKSPALGVPAIGVSDAPARVGHLALAIGRSWSNAVTATNGIVSVIGGPLPTGHGRRIDRVIRTTAPMHSGFAGGAFVDVAGTLIGIATAVEIRGLAVVIPADIALATARTLAEHGTLKRGYLGLAGQPVRLPAKQAGDDRTHALLVVGVTPGSPADASGLIVGDVIVDFDGEPIQSPEDLLERLQNAGVGRAVGVRVLRGGAAQDVTVTIGERPTQ